MREIQIKSNKNITVVIEKFIEKPPIKETKHHPKDCLCGVHMKERARRERNSFSSIIKQIRDRNYKP